MTHDTHDDDDDDFDHPPLMFWGWSIPDDDLEESEPDGDTSLEKVLEEELQDELRTEGSIAATPLSRGRS